MSETTTEHATSAQDLLEPSARALSHYVVRFTLLPLTMIMIKPRAILEAVQSGTYRPLPPPYLLSVVAGFAISAVLINLGMLIEQDRIGFINSVFASLSDAEGTKALLFAIPYVAVIWIFSGIVSFSRGQGFRNVDPFFAFMSFTVSAMVQLSLISLVGAHFFIGETGTFSDDA
ncbi:MAG: hypothetical protein AAFR82_10275, partial [Pseudomonadota bacterium]